MGDENIIEKDLNGTEQQETSAFDAVPLPVPEPEIAETEKETSSEDFVPEFTADDILAEITGTDESGYCRCAISATLEKIHGFDPNNKETHLSDENYEYVREMDIMYASADVFSLDGDIVNVILTFDRPDDVYIRELRDLLNSYRNMYEHALDELDQMKEDDPRINDVEIPQMTLTFLPYKYKGNASANYSNPIAWFVTIPEDSTKGQFYMQFHMDETSYEALDISEEVRTEIMAQVQREIEIRENTVYR